MTTDDSVRPEPAARPRPQFGELATPEQQRAAIAVPADVAAAESVPIADPGGRGSTPDENPAAKTETPPVASSRAKARDRSEADSGPLRTTDGSVTAKPPLDRFASWALLGLGLFNILTTSTALLDLPGAITQFFSGDDLDPYGPVGTARVLGIVALVVNAGLWILTLVVVQRRVNAGKISWWIPLVTGVVATLVVLVCVGGAMMIDPAVFQYIQQMSGATP